MNSIERVETFTVSFIQLLSSLGFSPDDIIDGMDGALEDFEVVFASNLNQ